jgi:FKBP-type peptidyl-prolyl cis-trans isomerase FkpA
MRLLSCLFVLGLVTAGCGSDDDGGMLNLIPMSPTSNVSFSKTDLRVGTGAEATSGRSVSVRYAGWLYAPTAVDNKGSQFDPGGVLNFTVGTGVVAGFSMGVNGMRVGGLRRVVIPPSLGYGNSPPSTSIIRPNETLLFEIELLAVQ